jgi:hypothetical protein
VKSQHYGNIAASVRQRLLNLSRERQETFELLLSRYGAERLLYRLSISPWSDRFTLKGAFLIQLWSDIPHRPTRDIDLLGYGPSDIQEMLEVFRSTSAIAVESDGIIFQEELVTAMAIKENNVYPGIRVVVRGQLDSAHVNVQIDIGFGDAVTPAAESIIIPSLLDLPATEMLAYPVETVIAEKYHAIVMLGMVNSRMKDYFDLYAIARHLQLQRTQLTTAIAATFERRETPMPVSIPIGLTQEFAHDTTKKTQWKAFLGKNGLDMIDLADAVDLLTLFLRPFFGPSDTPPSTTEVWHHGGPWVATSL